MNYQEFTEHIRENLESLIEPGQKVTLQTIDKNNGTQYQGIVIIDPILNISPTIYLEPFYLKYLNGTSTLDICRDILKFYQTFVPEECFDESCFTDFEKAKHRIVMKLIHYEKNIELLQKVPHIPYLDLAIVFVCSAGDLDKEYATILIHNHHLDYWNIDLLSLYHIAKENSPKLLPYHFENMEEYLLHHCNWNPCEDHIPMYLLTNQLKIHGASVILYEGLLEQISKELNSSFVVIPSSVHEVLVVPVQNKKELQTYSNMVLEVNATQLPEDEILSNHAYYYSKKYHVLS